MIFENELIMLLLGLGVLAFHLRNRSAFNRIIHAPLLSASLYLLVAAWCFTVLEGFFWHDLLNLLEHACYAASSLLLTLWVWKRLQRADGER